MTATLHCKTLLLGGTAFACGAATRQPQNCLILERGMLLIPEFAMTLFPLHVATPRTDAGRRILRELERRGIATAGKLHPPPVSDCFADIMGRRSASILLNAEPISLTHTEQGYLVTIAGNDGLSTLQAQNIIDTTPTGWQDKGMECVQNKALCAALCGKITDHDSLNSLKCAETVNGPLPGEHILKVQLPADTTWQEARIRLHDIMRQLQKRNPHLRIGGEATSMVFHYHSRPVRKILGQGIRWIPSAQYQDLITAFEEGYQCDCP